MSSNAYTYIEGSKVYKYVSKYKHGTKILWLGKVLKTGKNFDTEREAAIYVDTVLLNKGKKPVNILKAK